MPLVFDKKTKMPTHWQCPLCGRIHECEDREKVFCDCQRKETNHERAEVDLQDSRR